MGFHALLVVKIRYPSFYSMEGILHSEKVVDMD